MKFKAAIFDMDGTLIDSTWVWKNIFNSFCEMFNLKKTEINFEKTLYMTPIQGAEFIKTTYNIKESVLEIIKIWSNMAKECYENRVKLKPGAKRLLELFKLNNIPICLVTSCYVKLCELILDKFKLSNYFSHILYSEELKLSKKTTDIYLLAAKKMEIQPKFCAVFEDIFEPLKLLKSYGMGYFAVNDGVQSENTKKELKLNSDYFICDFNEFIDGKIVNKFFDLEASF